MTGEVVEFVDVMSGTRDDRPQLKKLLALAADGKVETVLCTRLDRMSRSTIHGGKLLRQFNQKHWPNLICLDQTIDLGSATGRFTATMLMGMAQLESEQIGERVHHGNMYNRRLMRPSSGKPPYGYEFTEGKANYRLDPYGGKVAREIIDHFLTVANIAETYRYQKQKYPGIRDWKGKLTAPFLTVEGLRRWLLNPALQGARVYGTFQFVIDSETGQKRKLLNKAGTVDELHPDKHPALLTAKEQETITAIMNRNKQSRTRPNAPRRARALSGLVFCGDCDSLMSYHRWKRGGPSQLRCHNCECPTRPHTAIAEITVREAALENLKANIELLAQAGLAEELQHRDALNPETTRLQKQIRALVESADPDVAPAIAMKRERLCRLMDEEAAKCAFSFSAAVIALHEPRVWDELTSDEERLRALFCQWVRKIVVEQRSITSISLRINSDSH